MTLGEVAYVTGTKIRDFKTINGNFGSAFERLTIKDGPILVGTIGFGDSPEEARKALASKVSGQSVVRNAYGDRAEFEIPEISV
jgi:hypothetical protein